jgi:signal transduction histidine kinase
MNGAGQLYGPRGEMRDSKISRVERERWHTHTGDEDFSVAKPIQQESAQQKSAEYALGPLATPAKSARVAIRTVLLVGFGGLIAIIVAGGYYSQQVARGIQARSTELQRDYLSREHMLADIGSDLFESGNTIRDYMLAGANEEEASSYRSEIGELRRETDAQLEAYSEELHPEERDAFRKLSGELSSYWSALNPALAWNGEQRKSQGYKFLDDEVIPRRANLLAIAKEIEQVNEQSLKDEESDIRETFAKAESRLRTITVLGTMMGIFLAALTGVYMLHLENVSEGRYKESLRVQKKLKELSARLVDSQESERRAISRELHDEVGQTLSSLLMEIDGLSIQPVAPSAGELSAALPRLRKLAQSTLNSVRDMSLLLRPSMLDDLGLIPALEWQAREVARRTGISVMVTEQQVSENLSDEYKTCIYRIVQEALNNAAKHAHAKKVDIRVTQEPMRIVLAIQDDGAGFDPWRVRGLGLTGISERVSRLNGKLRIESRPGAGTLLQVELPLPPKSSVGAQGITSA